MIPASAQAAGSGNGTLDLAIWEAIRASGLVAFMLLSVSVALGISVGVRALDWLVKRAGVLEAHQTLSVFALAFTVLHVTLLLANSHVPFALGDVLVPFAAGWRPVPAALGSLALYASALLVLTSYLRPLIGYKTWRTIHYLGFAAWIMALAHGISAGSDSSAFWVQYVYLVSGLGVGLLVLVRVLTVSSKPKARRAPAAAVARSHDATSSPQA
jgi:sulfoxide reductase heme-binding subunit YedZ